MRNVSTVLTNDMISAMLKKRGKEKNFDGIVYRTCSEIDLLDLLQINTALKKKERLGHIDMSTILATYEGHTIFSLYTYHPDVYRKIYSQLKDQDFEEEINSQKESLESNILRRLYRILKMPTMDIKFDAYKYGMNCHACENSVIKTKKKVTELCKSDCKGFKPVTLKSVSYTSEKIRDELIKISLYCNETDISNFVNAFNDMEALF